MHNNQCREPQAERQVDKSVGNFCDYFSYRVGAAATGKARNPRTQLDALFARKK